MEVIFIIYLYNKDVKDLRVCLMKYKKWNLQINLI